MYFSFIQLGIKLIKHFGRTTVGEPIVSQDTLDKKNRKKRAAKTNSPNLCISKLAITSHVEALYAKFMRDKQSFTQQDL